jgi:hypothetical protein
VLAGGGDDGEASAHAAAATLRETCGGDEPSAAGQPAEDEGDGPRIGIGAVAAAGETGAAAPSEDSPTLARRARGVMRPLPLRAEPAAVVDDEGPVEASPGAYSAVKGYADTFLRTLFSGACCVGRGRRACADAPPATAVVGAVGRAYRPTRRRQSRSSSLAPSSALLPPLPLSSSRWGLRRVRRGRRRCEGSACRRSRYDGSREGLRR